MVNCYAWTEPNGHEDSALESVAKKSQKPSRGRSQDSSKVRSTSPSAPDGVQTTTHGRAITSSASQAGAGLSESTKPEGANGALPSVQIVTTETTIPPTTTHPTLFSSAESATCAKMADSPKSPLILPAGINPYYNHNGICIIHGDCRDILPQLEGDSLVTDPPFGIDWGRATWADDSAAYGELMAWLVDESRRAIAQGWCFVFQAMPNIGKLHQWFPDGWRLFAACKNFAQIRPTGIWHSWDPVVFWANGDKPKPIGIDEAGGPNRDYFVGNVAGVFGDKIDHPCPKPFDTMRHIVGISTPPGGCVIEPFMGSGTTLVAAKDIGRLAIGIEIEEKYCAIAAKRLEQEVFNFGR